MFLSEGKSINLVLFDIFSDIYIFFKGVGMLCFNRRLGFLDSENVNDLNENVKKFFAALGLSFTMPFKTYCYFRTKLYKDFEDTALFLHRYDCFYLFLNMAVNVSMFTRLRFPAFI